jgi:hypothetical protein
MLLTDQIKVLRNQYLDDVVEPYLWSDPQCVSYIIQAEHEACERANLIVDESTPAVCQIPVQVGVIGYSLDPKVLLVKRVSYGTSAQHAYPLTQTTRSRLDETHPGWGGRAGQVSAYICEDNGEITIVPPTRGMLVNGTYGTHGTAGTAFLQVSRYPLNRLSLNSTAGTGAAGLGITYSETPFQYHVKMLSWAAHLAFLKNDSETFNLAKADKYEKDFERDFGKPLSAKTKQFMRSNNLNSARMRPRQIGS